MNRTLRRVLAAILWPISALSARAQPLPSGYDAGDDVFYQIMPIAWRSSASRCAAAEAAGAAGADTLPMEVRYRFGDFKGMTESLDYLSALGITGVWMTPIFPSPAYHGYQHGAMDKVNPWFGSEQDFTDFVKAAHALHIKVYIDMVAYGITMDSPWFKNALADPSGPDARMLAITDTPEVLKPGPTDKKYPKIQGYSFKTWDGAQMGMVHWDLRNPAARDLVIGWSKKWLDPNSDGDFTDGVDGYRLDHVWSRYQSGPDGWGYTMKDFWIPWKTALQKVNPKVFTFAEQAKWETNGVDLLPAHDAAFTKPLLFAVREAIKGGKAGKLAEAMKTALKEIPDGRTLLATTGDHDVDRVASSLGGDEKDNLERAKLVAGILMLQALPPVIYMGDEIGMRGTAGDFHSDANDIPRREPFKWTAIAGAPMTDYERLNTAAYAARISKDHDGRSVEEQLGKGDSLLELYKQMIRIRRENVAIRRGDYLPMKLEKGDEAVWCFARIHEKQRFVVAINVGAEERTVTFTRDGEAWNGKDIGPWKGRTKYEVLGTQRLVMHRITVPGFGVAVVKMDKP